jgi:hypothetical protein
VADTIHSKIKVHPHFQPTAGISGGTFGNRMVLPDPCEQNAGSPADSSMFPNIRTDRDQTVRSRLE